MAPARSPVRARVGRVRLQIADIDRSLAFYQDRIGLHEVLGDAGAAAGSHGDSAGPRDGAELPGGAPGRHRVARLGVPGGPVLLELIERPGVRPVPRTGLLGIYHFALLLPTRPDLGRFVRHHVRERAPFGAADHAFSEALYLEDPDGITVEVYADRPEDQWPVRADGGLPLVSDPLDTTGLMAVAGDAEWDGVPEGTTVGHMHFFIDDLDPAAAFYVQGLGLEPMITAPTALFVSAGGYHHHVGLNTWRAGAPPANDDDARLLDWELVVPDRRSRDAVADRLAAGGFHPERVADDIVARDPWGITVRITRQGA